MSVLALGGCAGPAPLVNPSGTTLAPTQTAFAFPPPGGPAITAVLERRFANATQQDILLSTSAHAPGQNTLRVQIFGPVDTSLAGEGRLRDGYLPIGDVGSEMRQMLPGIRMQRSPYYVQNKYGPFGYAVGRSASGDTCLYGWQRISSTGVTQTWIGNKGSIQVRLRLCDKDAPEQKLLEVMYGYTITSYFKSRNWNPYGEPVAPEPTLGKPGHPIYPVGVSRFETVVPRPSAPDPRTVRPRPPVQASAAPILPKPVGPTVPPPPGANPTGAAPSTPGKQPLSNVTTNGETITIVPPPPCAQTGASTDCQ